MGAHAEKGRGRTWLTPRDCADIIGHETTECVLAAIKTQSLPAVERTYPSGRVRYLVRSDIFTAWFEREWTPTKKAS